MDFVNSLVNSSSSTKSKHAQQEFDCPKAYECSQYDDAAYHMGLKRKVPEAMVRGLAL